MRITIIAVGGKMPAWVEQGVTEYQRRMPRELKIQWREIPLVRRGRDTSADVLRLKEGDKILKAIPERDQVIALDVKGKRWSTEQLAAQLTDWQMSGDNYSLLIGGPDGLSDACLQRAGKRWSLSDLTMPHPLVRILLSEQLYRAWTINANHPYHRE